MPWGRVQPGIGSILISHDLALEVGLTGDVQQKFASFRPEFDWWNLMKDDQIYSGGSSTMVDSNLIWSSFDALQFCFDQFLVLFSSRPHGFGEIQCRSNESCKLRWIQGKGVQINGYFNMYRICFEYVSNMFWICIKSISYVAVYLQYVSCLCTIWKTDYVSWLWIFQNMYLCVFTLYHTFMILLDLDGSCKVSFRQNTQRMLYANRRSCLFTMT